MISKSILMKSLVIVYSASETTLTSVLLTQDVRISASETTLTSVLLTDIKINFDEVISNSLFS